MSRAKDCCTGKAFWMNIAVFRLGSGPKTVAVGPWSVAVAVGDDGEEAVPDGPGGSPSSSRLRRRLSREAKAAAGKRILRPEPGSWAAYVASSALVGGQDEVVFAGGSFVVDPKGRTVARAPQFREHLLIVDIPGSPASGARSGSPDASPQSAAPALIAAPLEPLEGCTKPSSSPSGTTPAKTGSKKRCWACREAWTALWPPRWPQTP